MRNVQCDEYENQNLSGLFHRLVGGSITRDATFWVWRWGVSYVKSQEEEDSNIALGTELRKILDKLRIENWNHYGEEEKIRVRQELDFVGFCRWRKRT